MKKLIGIAVVLAVVTTLCFGSVALADPGPTKVVVNFNGDDPDVTVTAFAPGGGFGAIGTAQFTLNGSSYAVGQITASVGSGSWSPPSVYGGYTATGGDFSSQFLAQSSIPCYHRYYETSHSIDAFGVPYDPNNPIIIDPETDAISGVGMFVSGDATAPRGSSWACQTIEAGQFFWGQADSVTVDALRLIVHEDQGAVFNATITGDSPVSFWGQTEGKTDGYGSTYQVKHQGLGFLIDADSSIDAELQTTYAYTNVLIWDGAKRIVTQVVFEGNLEQNPEPGVGNVTEALAIIQAFNGDQIVGESATWSGLPGYTEPIPEPEPEP